MGNTAFEQRKRANAFFRSFNCNPMILFVGRHISDEELKLVADCPWSCVMTSRTDAAFSTYFKKAERSVQEYTTRAEIPARPLNREKLPILRLCGVEGHTQEEAANDDAFLESIGLSDGGADTAAANHAQELLQLLPSLLDCVSQMVVTGYRPETEGELSLAVFARALSPCQTAMSSSGMWIWSSPPAGSCSRLPTERASPCLRTSWPISSVSARRMWSR